MLQQAAQFARPSQDPEKVWVLKVHKLLRKDIPRSKIITTHRDPRDVLVSYKEFMKASFDASLECARSVKIFTETYKDYDSNYLLLVAYNDIEAHPVELILQIAEFLEVELSEIDARNIALKYSRNKVKGLIEKSDKSLAKKLAKNKPVDHRDIVYFSASNYRAFDRKTGFQTGHVSQRKTGDWKNVLSEVEQQLLNDEFGNWLKKFGYQ
jgi:hypothetical protein